MTARQLLPDDVAWGPSGLVPGVVQDAADGRVLMVAYVDAEALAATLATGDVHFHSRSRDRLWRKGETSGNVLRLLPPFSATDEELERGLAILEEALGDAAGVG